MATVRQRKPGVWEVPVFTGRDERGRPTQASRTDVHLVHGTFVVVGNAEADPAVAEVIAVDDDGVVLVRVLAGPVEEHQHRVTHLHQAG